MDAATIQLTWKEANIAMHALDIAEMDAKEYGEPELAKKMSVLREKLHHQLKYKNISDRL